MLPRSRSQEAGARKELGSVQPTAALATPHRIKDWGLSQTSLEEVFLTIVTTTTGAASSGSK